MQEGRLLDFAERYTAAWCSHEAASVSAFDSLLSTEEAPALVVVLMHDIYESI
jgi:hypothetical protein